MNPELIAYAMAIGAERGFSCEEVMSDIETLTRICDDIRLKSGVAINPLSVIGGILPSTGTMECDRCKTRFVYKRKDARYCSPLCKRRDYKRRRRARDRAALITATATNLAKRGNAYDG